MWQSLPGFPLLVYLHTLRGPLLEAVARAARRKGHTGVPGEAVELPKNWPPRGWENASAPKDDSTAAIGQWFDFILKWAVPSLRNMQQTFPFEPITHTLTGDDIIRDAYRLVRRLRKKGWKDSPHEPAGPVTLRDGTVEDELGRIMEWITGNEQDEQSSANKKRLFPEGLLDDVDIVDLTVRLDTEAGKPKDERKSMNAVAREFTGETMSEWDESKAKKLIARIRTNRNRGKINLVWD